MNFHLRAGGRSSVCAGEKSRNGTEKFGAALQTRQDSLARASCARQIFAVHAAGFWFSNGRFLSSLSVAGGEAMADSGARMAQAGGFGATLRRDAWWVEILPVVVVLGGFGIYATLRALEGRFYEWGPYL